MRDLHVLMSHEGCCSIAMSGVLFPDFTALLRKDYQDTGLFSIQV